MYKKTALISIIALLLMTSSTHANDVIRYHVSPKMLDEKQSYCLDLLKLALEESRHLHGDYELVPVHIAMTQGRTSIMLEKNQIVDVAWRMTYNDLENHLQAVYFPLLKGLMGARIFLIKKDNEYIFSRNKTLESLKQLSLGQGSDWPDTDILEYNGFQVIKANTSDLLLMLEKGRFEYYPRAIHEPWLEMNGYESLMIEKNLMLYYPSPLYFFINKTNKKLFRRINDGLLSLHASGRFETFFNEHPISSNIIKKSNINKRKIFFLENPLLSEKTRQLYKNKELWIDLPFELYDQKKIGFK